MYDVSDFFSFQCNDKKLTMGGASSFLPRRQKTRFGRWEDMRGDEEAASNHVFPPLPFSPPDMLIRLQHHLVLMQKLQTQAALITGWAYPQEKIKSYLATLHGHTLTRLHFISLPQSTSLIYLSRLHYHLILMQKLQIMRRPNAHVDDSKLFAIYNFCFSCWD